MTMYTKTFTKTKKKTIQVWQLYEKLKIPLITGLQYLNINKTNKNTKQTRIKILDCKRI